MIERLRVAREFHPFPVAELFDIWARACALAGSTSVRVLETPAEAPSPGIKTVGICK